MTAPLASPGGVTAETLAAFQQALAAGALDADALAKATTTQGFSSTTAIEGYNLEAPAKSLFPVLSPLRNRIPRVPSAGGSAVHWKAITAINASKVKAGVAEGVRNSVVSTTVADQLQAYKSFGLDDSVTFEAQINSKGFQDVRALGAANLLSAVMVEEEKLILGGNVTDIGKPGAITFADTAADASGSLTAATTYDVAISALTLYGYLNGATGRGSANSPDETDGRTGSHATTASGAGSDAIAMTWPRSAARSPTTSSPGRPAGRSTTSRPSPSPPTPCSPWSARATSRTRPTTPATRSPSTGSSRRSARAPAAATSRIWRTRP
jgi:hypothetical protein